MLTDAAGEMKFAPEIKGILSFSGGGVRGLFQAEFMASLYRHINVSDFERELSIVVGTSTGSIVAAGIAFGVAPAKIADLFRECAPQIFSPKWFSYVRFEGRYSNAALKTALKNVFDNSTLGSARLPLKICATDLAENSRKVFCSKAHAGVSVVEAVMASCAAPTYFPAVMVTSEKRTYVDGGLWANSPCLAALINEGFADRSTPWILHVGNGNQGKGTDPASYSWMISLGPRIVGRIIDMMFATQEEFGIIACKRLLHPLKVLAVEPELKGFRIELDEWDKADRFLPGAAKKAALESYETVVKLYKTGNIEGLSPSQLNIMDPRFFDAAYLPEDVIPKPDIT